MNTRKPGLRLHKATGRWMVKWDGRTRYLGNDRALRELGLLLAQSVAG